jgi:bifunctional UDP-N-acetylglucosamine pyrophosphorylase/glucosamine-1-phosphate N-acetyltransferase
MNVVILAAGIGKRMQSALPKVLHPLAGKPLLQHVIDAARTLEPGKLCVIYGHGGAAVPAMVQKLAADGQAPIDTALQQPQLGTGHAVMQAVPQLAEDAPTLVLYGDVPLTSAESLRKLVEAAGNDKLAIMTVEQANPFGLGRIIRDGGNIVRIVEEKDASEAERAIREINSGIMVIPTRHLKKWLAALSNNNAQGEYYLTDIVAQAVADGVPVVSSQPSAEWEVAGVNSKVQLAELERRHQLNIANALLEQGVTLMDPSRIDVRGELVCGRDVTIDVGCVFEGRVELGDGVSVGPHSVLVNAKIAAGAQIKPFCHIEDAVVGAKSLIGPYARLRPGTELGADVHVGNFVEIKNSQVAAHSKANHLAYVGDATVGSRAGTTLTKDAPAGKLTISRPKQMTIDGWNRPVKAKK